MVRISIAARGRQTSSDRIDRVIHGMHDCETRLSSEHEVRDAMSGSLHNGQPYNGNEIGRQPKLVKRRGVPC